MGFNSVFKGLSMLHIQKYSNYGSDKDCFCKKTKQN